MGEVIIPGFPTGMLVPGIYINVELGRQPPSAAGAVRKVLLVGTNTDDADVDCGTAAAGQLVRVLRMQRKSDTDNGSAEVLFGKEVTGPPVSFEGPRKAHLYWMAKAAFAANPLVSLYAIKVDASEDWDYDDVLSVTDGPAVAQQFHYIAMDDAAKQADLINYLEGLAHPIYGIRQQGIVANYGFTIPVDPLTQRSQRLQYVWSPQKRNTTPAQTWQQELADMKKGVLYVSEMLAAAMGAIRSRQESVDPAVNLSMEKVPGVPTAPSENAATKADLNSQCLTLGITPLVTQGSSSVILRSVTTEATTDTGAIYPVLDTTKVTVTDFVADDVELKMLNRYTGFKLAPDTDIPPPARTATPNGVKSSLLEWLREHEKAGRITMVSDLAERVLVEIDEEVPGRLNFQIPEDVIEIFAVGAGNIIQIG